MDGRGWRAIFTGADGTIRSGWRLLLFVVLFAVFLLVGALFVGPVTVSPAGLFRQGVVLLAAALGAGSILIARADRRPPGALGFAWTRHVPWEIGIGLAIGGGSMALLVGLLLLTGGVVYTAEGGTVADWTVIVARDLAIFGVAAAAEEAVFRGYPFQVLVQAIGPVAATLLGSGAFAVAHAANPNVNVFALLNIFLAGVLLSAAYLRTRSLWFATAVHTGWNWSMASLFDLPVSGLEVFDTPLYEPVLASPDWVGGGAFGPEGGLIGAAGFGLAVLAVLKAPGLDEAPELREKRPLVDSVLD